MHRFFALLAGFAISMSAAAAEFPAFLAGHWRTAGDGPTVTEEVWLAPAQNLMTGMSRTTGGRQPFFEFMRIEADGETLAFVAQPRGGAPTRFAQTRDAHDEIVFENAAHDFPQRVAYRLVDADTLEGRIEGVEGGKARVETWIYRRVVVR